MDDVEISRYAAEAFRHMDRAPHPSIDQMAEFAAGELTGAARDEFESHINTCDSCSRRLQEYEQFVSDAERPSTADLTPEWTRLRRRIQWRKAKSSVLRWPAAAAATAAIAGIAWFVIGLLTTSPATLLARAYQEQRPFEIRLANAKHSEIKRQRGGGSPMSENISWLKAKTRLEEESRTKSDDPETLRLLAEAQMMSGDAAKAVQTLQKARDLKPGDAAIQADLGAAYALRGGIEDQYGDYLSAIEWLGQSARSKPRDPEIIFNLAFALEKAQLKDQAIEQWKRYLELDPSSDWAKEARHRLDDLEKTLQSKKAALLHQTIDDPAQFLARVESGETIDAEAYLRDIVITKWLPLATSDGPPRQATIKLAQILKDRHGDTWLTDMVNSLSGTDMLPSLRNLAAARAGNLRHDDMNVTLASAKAAREGFLRWGSQPGIAWARFEEVLTLRPMLRHVECLAAADALIREIEAESYIWQCAELRIEYAICAMRVGRLGDAAVQMRQAAKATRTAGFGSAALTASSGRLVCVGQIGLRSEFFASAEQSLDEFWSGIYPFRQVYAVVDELRNDASRSGQKYAVWFLARAGVWALNGARDARAEAPAHANLAIAAQAIELESEARINLELSDRLFREIPAGFRWGPVMSLAKVDLDQGHVGAAIRRLEELRRDSGPPPSVLVEAQFNSVLGQAYFRNGDLTLAAAAFRSSINSGTRRVASLASERERSGVLETIENSYRGLVAVTLAGSQEGGEALRIWQSFRALDALGDLGQFPASNNSVLWFVELQDEFVCWLSRKDQVSVHRVGASKQDLVTMTARFLHECSDPNSVITRLREDAQQLYQWLVEPFAAQLGDDDGVLVFELDGALRGVPVQALISPDGRYLGDRFSVLVSSGCGRAEREDASRRGDHALVVLNPALGGESAELYPPLIDNSREADVVRSTFPNTTTLEGRAATVGAFARSLPTADIVHFAGHGYANSENGALLFAPRDSNADYELLRSTDLRLQDWSHCHLTVLAACAAAAGETRGAHNPDSLVRALTKAGVSRVAAGLWPVDSASTAELMKRFYTSMAEGDECPHALRAAQQQVRRLPEWQHPYYWSGFQLYGTA